MTKHTLVRDRDHQMQPQPLNEYLGPGTSFRPAPNRNVAQTNISALRTTPFERHLSMTETWRVEIHALKEYFWRKKSLTPKKWPIESYTTPNDVKRVEQWILGDRFLAFRIFSRGPIWKRKHGSTTNHFFFFTQEICSNIYFVLRNMYSLKVFSFNGMKVKVNSAKYPLLWFKISRYMIILLIR